MYHTLANKNKLHNKLTFIVILDSVCSTQAKEGNLIQAEFRLMKNGQIGCHLVLFSNNEYTTHYEFEKGIPIGELWKVDIGQFASNGTNAIIIHMIQRVIRLGSRPNSLAKIANKLICLVELGRNFGSMEGYERARREKGFH